MDRLQTLEVFIAVAEAQSFVGGAKRIGISAPSATRGVNALESRLGTRLFTRTTRKVRLTDVGESYFEDAKRIVAELQMADDAATGNASNPAGRLRITCPHEFGRIYIMPVVTAYLDTYPDVSAEVVMVDRVVNIVEEGFDIAVRIGALPSSGLSAIKVGGVRRVICGAPNYFNQYGVPQTPKDLTEHRIISGSPVSSSREWHFQEPCKTTVKINSRLVVSSIAAAIETARNGWGLTRVLSYQVNSDLAANTMQTVLADYEPEELPIHLVHTEGRRAAAKVRTFLDFASERIRDSLI